MGRTQFFLAQQLWAGISIGRANPVLLSQSCNPISVLSCSEALSGVEKSLGAGADCNLRIGDSTSRFGIELSAITNQETSSGRLGDDREGWRLNLVWRQQLGIGQILAQFV